MIKLIALDIDGTLHNNQHQITEATKQALHQAAANGIQIVLATGKTRNSSDAIKKQLNISTPGVYLQGLVLTNSDGIPTTKIELPADVAAEALKIAGQHGYPFTAYHDILVYILERGPATEWIVGYGEPEPTLFNSLEELLAQPPIQKIIFRHEPEQLAKLREILSAQFDGRATLISSQTFLLELLPLGCSKGAGLKMTLDQMGISWDEVIAFGDAENDLEMIQQAGIGVAMGNAMPILKNAADYTTKSNEEDGIAHALRHFNII